MLNSKSIVLINCFGELPDWAGAKIEAANAEQLEIWAEKIFEA